MQENKRLTKHKQAIARHFNRAAHTYNDAAFLEKELGARLLDRLDFIKQDPATILDLGSGIGLFSERLAERYPEATLFNFDLAENMLQKNRASQPALIPTRPLAICGDAEALPLADNSVDFIFSNCVFHWSLDLSLLFHEMHRVLKPGGLLLFSMLGPDTLKELRESFYLIDANPHVNNFMDMHHIGDALLQARFQDPVMDMEPLTITFPNLLRLIEDIRKSGSAYVLRENPLGLSPKNLLRTLSNHYNQFKTESGEIPASIEIIYGHAWSNSNKPLTKQTQREPRKIKYLLS